VPNYYNSFRVSVEIKPVSMSECSPVTEAVLVFLCYLSTGIKLHSLVARTCPNFLANISFSRIYKPCYPMWVQLPEGWGGANFLKGWAEVNVMIGFFAIYCGSQHISQAELIWHVWQGFSHPFYMWVPDFVISSLALYLHLMGVHERLVYAVYAVRIFHSITASLRWTDSFQYFINQHIR
jgi:hypothetical protein